jgi:hypothetical protein
MTEIGELCAANLTDEQSDDNCPFCYEKRHPFPSAIEEETAKVVSKPDQLGCKPLMVSGPWNHTTAKHHLISAMQCFARVRRLVRMATNVGYDINDPPNGIALPTVANNITYEVGTKGPQKFGRFDDGDKQNIAFAVMDQALAQWHVGHHAFEIDIPPDWSSEVNEDDLGHTVSYDQSVIKELLAIMDAWVAHPVCKKEDDQSSHLRSDMDALSKRIKDRLDKYGARKPRDSAPFYVSHLAFQYATVRGEAQPLSVPRGRARQVKR